MPTKRSAPAETVIAVEDFLCQLVTEKLHAFWSESRATWDLDSGLRRPADRRQDYLTLLATIRTVQDALDELAGRYGYRAKRNGADFAEIGAAAGISRQAARQRHLRQTVLKPVTMSGGPWDGRLMKVLLGEFTVSLPALDPWLEDRPWLRERLDPDDDPVYAVYQRCRDNPEMYRFQRYENPDGTPTDEPDHSLRIYRLADGWGLHSWSLTHYAKRVDPGVRGESSRLSPDAAAQLRSLIAEIAQQRDGIEDDQMRT
ncbi:MAG: hypothetical protein AVDCRST_MAG66-235 [uncultured Pseudonocardia sp.]|uniref:Uncharacterized protein n=1 Tax=uncultured Pseudonocardia sp. TaxID=211455 RepID=A0A6J4NC92_9PSEU|nr:MAG: hypothetical protein AVDCRST_MAG66-235 [uncultured Pseudonocardia sp.]